MKYLGLLGILGLLVACSDSDSTVGPRLCNSDADCGDSQICVNHACRDECGTDFDCDTGEECVSGACLVVCSGDGDCPEGELCQAGQCVPSGCIDMDDDGYGINCDKGGDCDDTNPDTYPGAPELCDGEDNDCDQVSDSGITCGLVCCASGEYCLAGACVRDTGDCTEDLDCQEDSYCHEGGCIPYGTGPRGDWNPDCTRLTVAGLFQPALQCEWTGAGDFANHLQVLGTPTVADFNFNNNSEIIRPSIVFNSYDGVDGDSGVLTEEDGVLRIIDGATCQTLFSLGPYLNGCNPVTIGDLDGAPDGRPEIVAHTNTGGVIAYKYNNGTEAFDVLWTGHDAGGAPVVFAEGATSWGGPSLADLDDDGSPEVLSGGLVY
ncbi:MAG: putative metal-binding motif-containing protein, partial [Lentisphaeria bacterium]|nr:putative metal-binding motif-containing protein [Lentisphaeria bacterium]